MLTAKLPKPVSKALRNDLRNGRRYNKIYKGFISSRDFYRLSNSNLLCLDDFQYIEACLTIIRVYISDATEHEIRHLQRKYGKVSLSIIVVRLKVVDHKDTLLLVNTLKLDILENRFVNQCGLRPFGGLALDTLISETVQLDFNVPVCPDYSYTLSQSGRAIYTFESLNNGIGLVAIKAIEKIKHIIDASKSMTNENFVINFFILIGDFEATTQNCSRLGESPKSFEDKLRASCDCITRTYPMINAQLFSDLLGGLKVWEDFSHMITRSFRLHQYSDLHKSFPNINHNNKFLSRLALYKRWHGNTADLKRVFLDQVIEYLTMGFALRLLHQSSILLACDHNVMHNYYVPNDDMIGFNVGVFY